MRPLVTASELFALCGFAVAAPLLDLIRRQPEFLVSHEAGASAISMLLLGLLLLPPAALLLLVRAVGLISDPGGIWTGRALVALLVGVTAFLPFARYVETPELLAYGLAAAIGLVGATLHARSSRSRELLRFLAWAPAIFALFFLTSGDVQALLWSGEARRAAPSTGVGGRSMVVVVFDELPLSSVQNAEGGIDAVRFPNLAALAADGTFFSAVSGVSNTTVLAIPPIVTGQYPGPETRLPILAAYPETLFTLLEGRYRLHVVESETLLYPNTETVSEKSRAARAALAPDLSLVYLHMILPEALRRELPPISDTWGRFWDRDALEGPDRKQQAKLRGTRRKARSDRPAFIDIETFEGFIETVASMGVGPPTLHFLHVAFPHSPWRVVASGSAYLPDKMYGKHEPRWPDEPWWSTDAWRRHLLQSMYADKLLGKLIATMKETGLYDRAILVVAADHGASFRPGQPSRMATRNEGQARDVLAVPLIIRDPARAPTAASSRVAETIDILPSLAELAGFEVPWPMDGCSLYSADCPERLTRRMFTPVQDRRNDTLEFEAALLEDRSTLERKLELFGSAELGLYRAGHRPDLAGRPLTDFQLDSGSAGTLRLNAAVDSILKGERPALRPLRIAGLLESKTPFSSTPTVALAVEGRIAVLVPAPLLGKAQAQVAAMLPEPLLEGLPDGLAIYLVDTPPAGAALPRLRPIEIE